jgi:hypothetical protein
MWKMIEFRDNYTFHFPNALLPIACMRCCPILPNWARIQFLILACSPKTPAYSGYLARHTGKSILQAGKIVLQRKRCLDRLLQMGKFGLQHTKVPLWQQVSPSLPECNQTIQDKRLRRPKRFQRKRLRKHKLRTGAFIDELSGLSNCETYKFRLIISKKTARGRKTPGRFFVVYIAKLLPPPRTLPKPR